MSRIKLCKQHFNYDCGHACLRMLGYDAYRMFPQRQPLNTNDLASVPGARRVRMRVGDDDSLDFSITDGAYIISFIPRGKVLTDTGHWVVRDRDYIYCSRAGQLPQDVYKRKFVGTTTVGEVLAFLNETCPPQMAGYELLGVKQAIYVPFASR